MVKYTIVNDEQLDDKLTEAADAIRGKTGKTEKLDFLAGDFKTEIEMILAVSVSENPIIDDLKNIHVVFSKATSIGNAAFRYYTGIKSLGFPKVESVGTNAFSGCSALANIDIPVVKTIGDYAFFGTALTKVDLPAVTSIGASAFQKCASLTTVIIRSASLPSIGANAFAETPIASGTGSIYVPDDLVDDYKKEGTNWYTYASQIKPLSTYTGN